MSIDSGIKNELKILFPDERACLDYLCAARWHNEPVCPHCSSSKIYSFSDRKSFKCAKCAAKFSVRTGTIFEDSKLPIYKWLNAIWLITQDKSAVSSTVLAKEIDVTQKTAWLILNRLRLASITKSFNSALKNSPKQLHQELPK